MEKMGKLKKLIAIAIVLSMIILNPISSKASVTGLGFKIQSTEGFCPYYGLNIYQNIYSTMNEAFVKSNGAAGVYNIALWPEMAHSSVDFPNLSDGLNKIYTVSDPNTDYVGRTSFLYYSNGYLLEADINLNMAYPFSVSGSSDSFDLVSVLMHELGHVSGLDDTYADSDRNYVMYGYTDLGRVVSDYSAEEKTFLYNLYH